VRPLVFDAGALLALERRDGRMVAIMRARLEAADDATLDVWTERILFAATLDDLLAS
jgi:hypothetical protein